MDLGAAGLKEQPFPTHGRPSEIFSYGALLEAIEVLETTYSSPTGLSLLQGPTLSGKSTLIRRFINSLHEDCAVAVVDGRRLNTTNLLLNILRQFGYNLELTSASELLGLIRVFTLQQAAYHEPPLLIIENVHELNPSALRALCELAELRIRTGSSALKIVLVSDRSLHPMLSAPAMESISRRLLHDFHLRPLSASESQDYLYTKLREAGSDCPEFVFPESTCAELHEASGGWPGILDRLALLALSRAGNLPVAADDVEHPVLPAGTWDEGELALAEQMTAVGAGAPQMVITGNGKVIAELTLDRPRMLIGRSEHNDIAIGSQYISRHHAMLVRHGSSTFLMDLNSTNGTFVNGRRISNYVLVHDDVISIGNHKIKFSDPHARKRGTLEGSEFADTAIMKSLDDMRSLLAKENTELLPAASEDLPTIQG